MTGIVVYMFLSVCYSQLSPLNQVKLPMTLREYYQKINVEEDKWLVTYLSRNWTGGITHLTDIPNWGTVIVGEEQKAPIECKIPKCFYVGPFEIDLLNFSITKNLIGAQKILIGQLVAVILGAEQIFPIDIDRIPLESLPDMDPVVKTSGLVHSGGSVFNPYTFNRFAFSTDHIFTHTQRIKPLLQAATRGRKNQNEREETTIFHMSLKSFVNLNQLDVIYGHDSFWCMVHPILRSVLGYGELDSFWVQKIIHSMGRTVSVYKPVSSPHRLSNVTLPNFPHPDPFVADVIESLDKFKCKSGVVQITKCIDYLFHELIKRRLFMPQTMEVLANFLSDLQAINYHFPVIEYFPLSNDFEFKIFLSKRRNLNPVKRNLMKYSNINKICPGRKFQWHNPRITDILLIITFTNQNDYSQLPVLDFMYRRWFKNVMFCGPNISDFTDYLNRIHFPSNLLDIKFVDGLDKRGLFIQKCMMAAMVIKFDVKGYIQIKSNALLNPWTVVGLPRDKIVQTGNMGTIDATKDKMQYWDWWAAKCGKAAWTKFFSFLHQSKATDALSKSFLDRFTQNTKPNTAYYSGWNVFYIPSKLQDNFVHAANKTLTSGLMNELALPAIVLGLQNKTEFHRIKDHSLWGDASLKYNILYNSTDIYLYQFNLGAELKTAKGKSFLCDNYLKNSETQLKIKH